MTQNDDLKAIRDSLNEASTEIPARLDHLLAEVEAGRPADPALVAEVKALASGLAGIVPNDDTPPAPVEPSPENPAPVTPAPVETPETPEPAPVDPAAEPEQPIEQETPPVDPNPVATQAGELLDAAGTPDATVDAANQVADGRLPG